MPFVYHEEKARERFWSKVEKTNGCWLWRASGNGRGYGMVTIAGKRMLAHRLSYIWKHGEVPQGLELDHLCRNRGCVNPDHLEPVTRRENQLRGMSVSGLAARKTHCPRGHEYAGDNLHITAQGHRHCKACWSIRKREAASARGGWHRGEERKREVYEVNR